MSMEETSESDSDEQQEEDSSLLQVQLNSWHGRSWKDRSDRFPTQKTWWNKKASRQQARQAAARMKVDFNLRFGPLSPLLKELLKNQLEMAKPPIDSWRTIVIDPAKEGSN